MPTFAPAALKNLLEPGAGKRNPLPNPDSETGVSHPRHLYISPALYSTPKQAPIPDSFSQDRDFPSPYVVNHNRRARRGLEEKSAAEVSDLDLASGNEVGDRCLEEEAVVNGFRNDESDYDNSDSAYLDAMSESRSAAEFLDANDKDFSEDGCSSKSSPRSYHLEELLQATRLSVVVEIERRKAAEEAITLIRALFSETGLTFPAPSAGMELDDCSINQMLQELIVSKLLAESIAAELARAEAEEAFSAIIVSKGQDIQRLRDRLRYCELVNHEMSQRKLVEVARQQQERKKRNRRRWMCMWGSVVGLSLASLAVYVYAVSDAAKSEMGDTPQSSSGSPSERH